MTAPHDESTPSAPPGGKRAWEPPTITLIGLVRDLVHAQGKVSGGSDGDAGNIRKLVGLG